MKPTITKLKDARGRITRHIAAIGPIEGEGKTPAEASDACEKAILDALNRLSYSARPLQWQGHNLMVVPTIDGWSYWLDTFSQGYSVQLTRGTFEEAQDKALHHLAQHVWNHEVTDDAAFVDSLQQSLRGEFTNWIRFQRAYKIHAAKLGSNNETHRLACEDSYKDSPELFRRAG